MTNPEAIQSLLNAVAGQPSIVTLMFGTYDTVPLVIPHCVTLIGQGRGATILRALPNATEPVVSIAGTSKRSGIEKLGIDGNKAGGANCLGLHIWSSNQGVDGHIIRDVRVIDTKRTGVALDGTLVGVTLDNVQTITCDGHGFEFGPQATDNMAVNCNTNLCGLNGFDVRGCTNHFANCGANDNGTVDATDYGDGWRIYGPAAIGVHLSGCWSQDNFRHGLMLDADSNSIDLTMFDNEGDAVRMLGGTGNMIRVLVSRTFNPTHTQSVLNAIGGSGNVFDLTYGPGALVAGATPLIGPAINTVGSIRLNGVQWSAVELTE